MQRLFFTIAFISVTSLLAQSAKWASFENDPYFRYELPGNFDKNVAKNQTTYSSSGKYCIFMVSMIRQPGIKTSAPYHLEAFYKGLLRTVHTGKNTVSDSLLMFRGFLADRITMQTKAAANTEITEATFVLVKNVSYVFSITFSESNRGRSKEERDYFISSIHAIGGHPYGYQYTNFDKDYETGEKIGRILRYIFPLFIVIAVLLIILKKWKAVRIMKNIAGCFFLTLTIFELLAFMGAQETMGKYFTLALSVTSCAIGVILLLIKVKRPQQQEQSHSNTVK